MPRLRIGAMALACDYIPRPGSRWFRGLRRRRLPGVVCRLAGRARGGSERDAATEAWKDRYFEVGLPFAIVAAATTVAWLLALGRRWVLLLAVAPIALLALALLVEPVPTLLLIFLLPAFLLLVIPWQAAAVTLAGLAVTALAFKPLRERLGIHVAALYAGYPRR